MADFVLASHPQVRCTASLGVAALGPSSASTLEAIAQADSALVRAKEAGRNRVERHETPIIPLKPA